MCEFIERMLKESILQFH
uniref:Uncharacterized protein n=1 Tax=Anguilla anguilla TaxID=7936 RepID=A0A0E9V3R8_ANGAN